MTLKCFKCNKTLDGKTDVG